MSFVFPFLMAIILNSYSSYSNEKLANINLCSIYYVVQIEENYQKDFLQTHFTVSQFNSPSIKTMFDKFSKNYSFISKTPAEPKLHTAKTSSVSFIELIFFWERWWFTVLGVLIFAIIIGVIIRYIEITKLRTKLKILEHQEELERERLRIARDMHDEVGANLTEISVLCELVNKSIVKLDSENARIVREISAKSRNVIDNIGEIIWAINPINDGLENLASYIRNFTGNFFKEVPVKCSYNFPDEIPELHLSAEIRRNIFLVVKEALHNILKHSKASKINLSLKPNYNSFKIIIEDNGTGFNIDNISKNGNGLTNMKKRIEEMGGQFLIESKKNIGTKVTINIELTKLIDK